MGDGISQSSSVFLGVPKYFQEYQVHGRGLTGVPVVTDDSGQCRGKQKKAQPTLWPENIQIVFGFPDFLSGRLSSKC